MYIELSHEGSGPHETNPHSNNLRFAAVVGDNFTGW